MESGGVWSGSVEEPRGEALSWRGPKHRVTQTSTPRLLMIKGMTSQVTGLLAGRRDGISAANVRRLRTETTTFSVEGSTCRISPS